MSSEPLSSPEFRRSGPRKPVIGLSVGYHDFGDYQGVGFQRPLVMAGGIPLILSCVEERSTTSSTSSTRS